MKAIRKKLSLGEYDGKKGENPRDASSKEKSGKRDKIKKDIVKRREFV